MDKYERQTELQALNATLETVYHEIEKNRMVIDEASSRDLLDNLRVVHDAKERISQLEKRADKLEEQLERFRNCEGDYADDDGDSATEDEDAEG